MDLEEAATQLDGHSEPLKEMMRLYAALVGKGGLQKSGAAKLEAEIRALHEDVDVLSRFLRQELEQRIQAFPSAWGADEPSRLLEAFKRVEEVRNEFEELFGKFDKIEQEKKAQIEDQKYIEKSLADFRAWQATQPPRLEPWEIKEKEKEQNRLRFQAFVEQLAEERNSSPEEEARFQKWLEEDKELRRRFNLPDPTPPAI
jgi:hypothetical protein